MQHLEGVGLSVGGHRQDLRGGIELELRDGCDEVQDRLHWCWRAFGEDGLGIVEVDGSLFTSRGYKLATWRYSYGTGGQATVVESAIIACSGFDVPHVYFTAFCYLKRREV